MSLHAPKQSGTAYADPKGGGPDPTEKLQKI